MIHIIEICPDEDGYTVMFFDKELIAHGDYYHDKIEDWIDGWIAGYKFIVENISIEIKNATLNYRESHENDYWYNQMFIPSDNERLEDYLSNMFAKGFYLDEA